ncbi:hypothetical protein [Corynebacterium alimapuense]|uniref:Uncharacterized protein n=1 Tax=Corynebacterium alimapuense TaxID=1576874 RepID=A0A3M8K720_9CORY|nr:hypothetical protein [Corynebacterium alimapuense]RNE48956.1 hypothetical protein C5L39_06635 [Corynebacterium alimapuense]
MAKIQITEQQVTIRLDWWEKISARRSHLSVPIRAITGVSVVADACEVAGALKKAAGGTQARPNDVTGTINTTTAEGDVDSTFSACHGHGPGIVLDLDSATVNHIIISTSEAEHYAQQLTQYIG